MGRLFEGITFSYQDEINKMRAAREEMESAQKEMESAQKEMESAQKEMESAQKEMEKEMEKEIEAARRESRMMSHIYKMLIHHHSVDEIKNSLRQEFGLSEQEAGEEYQKAVE